MQIIVEHPSNISSLLKDQVLDLIVSGGQVKYQDAKVGLHHAHLLAIYLGDGEVISSACLKNPRTSYYDTLSNAAYFTLERESYSYELGYIATKLVLKAKKYVSNY